MSHHVAKTPYLCGRTGIFWVKSTELRQNPTLAPSFIPTDVFFD